jgi:hypothetical protein
MMVSHIRKPNEVGDSGISRGTQDGVNQNITIMHYELVSMKSSSRGTRNLPLVKTRLHSYGGPPSLE